MRREYLKKATLTSKSDASETKDIVRAILDDIETGGDAKALEYSAKFDQYDGPILLSEADIEAAIALVHLRPISYLHMKTCAALLKHKKRQWQISKSKLFPVSSPDRKPSPWIRRDVISPAVATII